MSARSALGAYTSLVPYCLLLCAALGAIGCLGTETGNPPLDEPTITAERIGLRGDDRVVGTPGAVWPPGVEVVVTSLQSESAPFRIVSDEEGGFDVTLETLGLTRVQAVNETLRSGVVDVFAGAGAAGTEMCAPRVPESFVSAVVEQGADAAIEARYQPCGGGDVASSLRVGGGALSIVTSASSVDDVVLVDVDTSEPGEFEDVLVLREGEGTAYITLVVIVE